ncbi:alanine--tRNA ligase, cytoplasmic-like [Glandiceps talaboti]
MARVYKRSFLSRKLRSYFSRPIFSLNDVNDRPVSERTARFHPIARSSSCSHVPSPRTEGSFTSREIRRLFIDYFRDRHEHLFVPSSSTLPRDDKTLLFTNAGMNQFKSIFQGTVHPTSPMAKYRRVVNSQKCVRAGGKHNDLNDVGKDVYHHTFFEMLGSWSFGDYFKEEACQMAWELLTNVYNIPADRLYFTYFGGNPYLNLPADTECQNIWRNMGVSEDRIIPCGMTENFWEMGHTGPCGVCSEIHYDRIGGRDASSLVNNDDPDVLEIWNLVFPQFNREEDGSLKALSQHNVDTGMGLERLVSVIQGVTSNYDTDLFQPLMQAIQKGSGAPAYMGRVGSADCDKIDMAYRVVADHARTLTVTITDGVKPGYNKQEYIIKRLMRRAVRYAIEILNAPPGLLGSLVPVVVDSLGHAYPELTNNPQQVIDIINKEEEQFLNLLKEGRRFLDKKIKKLREPILPGTVAWKMHDGFGFPIDLTILMAEEKGIQVDMEEYEVEKEKSYQITSLGGIKNRSHVLLDAGNLSELKARHVTPTDDSYKYDYDCDEEGNYDFESIRANIEILQVNNELVDTVDIGQKCQIILDKTCFYAEQGGQLWDDGYFTKARDRDQQVAFEVDNVQVYGGYIVHSGTAKTSLSLGDRMKLFIDEERRLELMRNHTATHILNWSLRTLLGDGIEQGGSLVAADKLRFDFSYADSLSMSQVEEIQDKVNEVIEQYTPIYSQEVSLEDAMKIEGLRAVFGEIYPDPVNVVSIGIPVNGLVSNPFGPGGYMSPVELCGGTHVLMTEHVGKFIITDEGAIGSGLHRITAITGPMGWEADAVDENLQTLVDQLKSQINHNLETLKISMKTLYDEASQLQDEISRALIPVWRKKHMKNELEKMMEKLRIKEKKKKKVTAKEAIRNSMEKAKHLQGKEIIVEEIDAGSNLKTMQQILFKFENTTSSAAIMLYSVDRDEDIVSCICYTSKEAISRGLKAGEWIDHINNVVDGKSGGQDDVGRLQAKIISPDNIMKVKDLAEKYANSKL